MKIRQRALALLLSLAMVLTFMPALAFAGSENEGAEQSITTLYKLREGSSEDRFTWMEGEGWFLRSPEISCR